MLLAHMYVSASVCLLRKMMIANLLLVVVTFFYSDNPIGIKLNPYQHSNLDRNTYVHIRAEQEAFRKSFSLLPNSLQHFQRIYHNCTWTRQNGTLRGLQTHELHDVWDFWRAKFKMHQNNYAINQGLQLNRCEINESNTLSWLVEVVGVYQPRRQSSLFRWKIPAGSQLTEYHMTASIMAPVDSFGGLIPAPPLHVHHAHTYQVPTRHIISQTHGDSMCKFRFGGAACYMEQYPRGYGIPLAKNLTVDFAFVVDSSLNKFNWSAMAAYQITHQHPKRLTQMWIQGRVSYKLGLPAIAWYTVRMPRSGHFVWNYWHTHHSSVIDVIALSGDSHQVGLQSRSGSALHYFSSFDSQHAFWIQRLATLRDHNKEIKCHIASWADRWEVVNHNFVARFEPARCVPWRFRAGENVTIVALLGEYVPGVVSNKTEDWFHIHLHGLASMDSDKAPSTAIIPNTKGLGI